MEPNGCTPPFAHGTKGHCESNPILTFSHHFLQGEMHPTLVLLAMKVQTT
jgi:hypothetical protein